MLQATGASYDYSQFGQYHTSLPPSSSTSLSDPLHAHTRQPYTLSPRSHPLSQRHHSAGSGSAGSPLAGGGSMHSFSNVEKLRSMSPQSPLPPPLILQEDNPDASIRRYSNASASGVPQQLSSLSTGNPPQNASTTPTNQNTSLPQQPPDGSASMSTSRGTEEEEDPRIRAYAKLEFPTFDIYIQKLSVIVGRRPAVVAPSPALLGANSLPLPNSNLDNPMERLLSSPSFGAGGNVTPGKSESVKLEDFVIGMADGESEVAGQVVKVEADEAEELARREEEKEREYAAKMEKDRIEFSDFLKSSPSFGPVVTVKDVDADLTSLVLDPVPSASTSVLPSTSTLPLPASPSLNAIPTTSQQLAGERSLIPTPSPKVPPQPSPPAPATIVTDIDLGPIRAVSRQHARLYFDYEMGGWALEVLGRNGVVVEGRWKAKGEKEGLGRRSVVEVTLFCLTPTLTFFFFFS